MLMITPFSFVKEDSACLLTRFDGLMFQASILFGQNENKCVALLASRTDASGGKKKSTLNCLLL